MFFFECLQRFKSWETKIVSLWKNIRTALNFATKSALLCKIAKDDKKNHLNESQSVFVFVHRHEGFTNQPNLDSCVKTFQFSFELSTFPRELTAFIFLLRRYSHAIQSDNGWNYWHMKRIRHVGPCQSLKSFGAIWWLMRWSRRFFET